jgi:hypothetical protein
MKRPAMTKRRRRGDTVGVDELKDAILQMIVEKFGDRVLTWEDATMALSLAAFEIKQTALFLPRAPTRPRAAAKR